MRKSVYAWSECASETMNIYIFFNAVPVAIEVSSLKNNTYYTTLVKSTIYVFRKNTASSSFSQKNNKNWIYGLEVMCQFTQPISLQVSLGFHITPYVLVISMQMVAE